jgi:hypothetical protein
MTRERRGKTMGRTRRTLSEISERGRGDIVVCRTFGGKPKVNRVWDTSLEAIYCCNEERFQAMWRGEPFHPYQSPLGFPAEDVFGYDAALLAELESRWETDPAVWDKATPYTPQEDVSG